ncbi:MAG: hormogonium polysaccharide biosynthesis glycosyltransferase HpsE [Prochlorotrichaceae cyanobacterium]
MDFTIAICTFNGAKRLPTVLDRIQVQQTTGFSWETLVVDNASTDTTAIVVKQYQQNWPISAPLRYVQESKPGLTHARRKAFHEAKAGLVGFLDDDNWPDPNWVSHAYHFGLEHPRAGAYGSCVRPFFDEDPPAGFNRIALYFALRPQNKTYCYNDRYQKNFRKIFPPGAGVVIRQQAWLNSVPQKQFLTGVKGKSLVTKSEDVEMISYIFYRGWEVWHCGDMKIQHHIPSDRFQPVYLNKFFRGIGRSRYITRMQAYPILLGWLLIPGYLTIDIFKIVIYFLRNFKDLKTDVIKASEWKLLLSVPEGLFVYIRLIFESKVLKVLPKFRQRF